MSRKYPEVWRVVGVPSPFRVQEAVKRYFCSESRAFAWARRYRGRHEFSSVVVQCKPRRGTT